ncbi:hypothetical protein ACFLTR_01150 [Chloroflexota bacterium]
MKVIYGTIVTSPKITLRNLFMISILHIYSFLHMICKLISLKKEGLLAFLIPHTDTSLLLIKKRRLDEHQYPRKGKDYAYA